MATSEVIIVESTNTSSENNRTTAFSVRLPREFIFNHTHQLALVDVQIPNTIFNVQEGNFFILSLFTAPSLRVKRRGTPSFKLVRNFQGIETHISRFETVKVTAKVTIPPGYYESFDSLLVEVEHSFSRVVGNADLELKSVKGISVVSILQNTYFHPSRSEGWFSEEENVEELISDTLSRLAFRLNRGAVEFHPAKKEAAVKKLNTCFHFSEDIKLIFGFPPDRKYVFLPASMSKVEYAPYLSRIQSEDTIYIYCDQIGTSIVSNVETRILRCLPFSSRKLGFGDMFFQEFINHLFVDISSLRMRTLSFELRNNRGSLINFQSGSKPVRLTLQIRPKENIFIAN